MPSTKDPNTVVQPGPGLIPAGTVPASALLFVPREGSSIASDVAYAGDGPWVDGTANPGTDVGSQLTKIITDLTNDSGGASSSPHSGADRISARTSFATFADSTTINGLSIQTLTEAILVALASTTVDHAGSDKVAARTSAATFADSTTITGASVQALVEAIVTALASVTVNHAGSDKVAARSTNGNFVNGATVSGATVQAILSAIVSAVGTGDIGGDSASISGNGTTVTVTGLAGVSPTVVGSTIRIFGSSKNDGLWTITAVVSATEVQFLSPFNGSDTGWWFITTVLPGSDLVGGTQTTATWQNETPLTTLVPTSAQSMVEQLVQSLGNIASTAASGGSFTATNGAQLPGTFGVTNGMFTVTTTADLTNFVGADSLVMFQSDTAVYSVSGFVWGGVSGTLTLNAGYAGTTGAAVNGYFGTAIFNSGSPGDYSAYRGQFLTITNSAASPSNNGSYQIMAVQVISNHSFVSIDPGAAGILTTEASFDWSVSVGGAQLIASNTTFDSPPLYNLMDGDVQHQLNGGVIGFPATTSPTSLLGYANAQRVVFTCGDGTVSFGDFNGPDAINQAVNYWIGLSPLPLSATIHLKAGTYQQSSGLVFDASGPGLDLKVIGDGKTSTIINGTTGGGHWTIVATGCQITYENVSLITNQNQTGPLELVGSIRAKGCYFGGVEFQFNNVGTPLLGGGQNTYFAIFDDCEIDHLVISSISGASNSGGLVEITTSSVTTLTTGAVVNIYGVSGTYEANGQWTITVIDSHHFTLNGSTFAHAYTSGGQVTFDSYFLFEGNSSGAGFLFRGCTFVNSGPALFQFVANSTNTTWSEIGFERCVFNLVGVPTISSTAIYGPGGIGPGIMAVNGNGNDLTMTLDKIVFDECNVTSGDTKSDSVVLLHLFPLSFDGTGTDRVRIQSVTIRRGTWEVAARGSDFAPFFLMCTNPVIEDLILKAGGGTAVSTSPSPGDGGSCGNGIYTNAMQLALTGTTGYGGSSNFFATVAASGYSQFSSVGDAFGNISAFTSPTVTFTDVTTPFVPGMVGLSITIEGAANAANNGTFTITGCTSTSSISYSNAAAVYPDANSGSITWSISSGAQSGMVVRNLEVHNSVPSSGSGDLCLVGPVGSPAVVDGIYVTNIGGALGSHLPMTRIYIRPGANYSVSSNVATVTSGGTNGAFRGITWQARNDLVVSSGGGSFTAHTGTGSVSTGIVCLGYTGDLHVADVKLLAPQAFDPSRSPPNQYDVLTGVAITCTELWGTFTPAALRGHLRLHDCYCENMGQDLYGQAAGYLATTQAFVTGFSAHYTLSDFATIDASSLETYANFNNNTLSTSNAPTGIQVIPQYSLRGGSSATISAFSSPTVTLTGLTGMQPSDAGGYLMVSGANTSGNNSTGASPFLITAVLSSTSVHVSNVSGHFPDTHSGNISWAVVNNNVSKWNVSECRVEFDSIPTGFTVVGFQSFWTLGTAQGLSGLAALSYGDTTRCYVSFTTTNSTWGSITPINYIFGSVDQNGGGQTPSMNCFSNTSQQTTSAGILSGNFEAFYYAGTTQTVIASSGYSPVRGLETSFGGASGSPERTPTDALLFNNGLLKSP